MSSPRFNRWSFKNNKRPDRSNGDQYYYITDFNQVSDKDCINFDKLNDKIYLDNLKLFNDLTKKIKNSAINMIDKPKPPMRPNNYERLFIWRQRHVKLSVEDQTISILYLLSKNIPIKLPNSYDELGIEPFEAIIESEHLAKELREDKKRIALEYVEGLKLNKKKQNKNASTQVQTNYIVNKKDCDGNKYVKENNKCDNYEQSNVEEKVLHFSKINSEKSNNLYPKIEINNRELSNEASSSEQQPVNMNFHLKVDNGVTTQIPRTNRNSRASMYLQNFEYPHYMNDYPEHQHNVSNAQPSAPPPNYNN